MDGTSTFTIPRSLLSGSMHRCQLCDVLGCARPCQRGRPVSKFQNNVALPIPPQSMLLCTSCPTDGSPGRIFTNDGVFRVSSQTVSLQHSLTHPLIGIFPGFRVAVYCPNDNFHVHQSTVGIGGGGRRGRREETDSGGSSGA